MLIETQLGAASLISTQVPYAFLAESSLIGLLGGLLGSSLGTTSVVLVSVVKHWTPLMETWTVGAAPLIGLAVGLTAGAYPALRAARVEPADALSR